MSRRTTTLVAKLRQRHQEREFDRAVRSASPSMQQELLAAASRRQRTNLL